MKAMDRRCQGVTILPGQTLAPALLFFALSLVALPAWTDQEVRGVKYGLPELKVIDEKCLNCHNRKRIDNAIQDRKDLEKVLSGMEKKGVALTESDRRVIGHFWQQKLFREKKGTGE